MISFKEMVGSIFNAIDKDEEMLVLLKLEYMNHTDIYQPKLNYANSAIFDYESIIIFPDKCPSELILVDGSVSEETSHLIKDPIFIYPQSGMDYIIK